MPPQYIQLPRNGVKLAAADLDRDGDKDILMMTYGIYSGASSVFKTVYRNDGHGNFTQVLDEMLQYNNIVNSLAVGDFNNDLKPDAVTVYWSTGPLLLRNTGDYHPILTLNKIGQGEIATTSNPPYTFNQTVHLTANPAHFWRFDHWSGDATGNANSINVTMDSNKTVTATFVSRLELAQAVPAMVDL